MLIDFTIKNYLSFKDEKTFSFLCNSKNVKEEVKLLSVDEGKYQLYTASVILGPNASGKTNFMKAFVDFRSFVTHSSNYEINQIIPCYKPFKLNTKSLESPTIFDIEFVNDNQHYSYKVEFNGTKVISETLSIFTKKINLSKSILLERKEQEVIYGAKFKGNKAVFSTLMLPNKLLLSLIGNSNNEMLKPAYDFFSKGLNTDFSDQKNNVRSSKYTTTSLITGNMDLKELTIKMLKAADIQVTDIEFGKDKNSEFEKETSELSKDIPFFKHDVFDENHSLKNETLFDLYGEESAGTNKLFEMASFILITLIEGKVLIIDELSSSLHPKIELFIIKLFLDNEINVKGAQLLINTHNINIIDNNLFTREQVWFTDRNKYGESNLFCLDEFDKNLIRDYANYGKSYCDNRLGALPNPCLKSFKDDLIAYYAQE